MGTHWGEPASYDRLDEVRRDAAAVAALWQGAQVLPVGSRGVLPTRESATAVEFVTTPAGGPYDPQRHWLLGRDGDRVSFTMIDDEIDGVTIREVGAHLAPVDLNCRRWLSPWRSGTAWSLTRPRVVARHWSRRQAPRARAPLPRDLLPARPGGDRRGGRRVGSVVARAPGLLAAAGSRYWRASSRRASRWSRRCIAKYWRRSA
jgi:hypothetical protein